MKKAIKLVLLIELIVFLSIVILLTKLYIHDALNHGKILYPETWGDRDFMSGFVIIITMYPIAIVADNGRNFKNIVLGYDIFLAVKTLMIFISLMIVRKTTNKNKIVPLAIITLFIGSFAAGVLMLISNPKHWEIDDTKASKLKEENI